MIRFKQFLRKWLEIPDNPLIVDMDLYVKKADIETMALDVMYKSLLSKQLRRYLELIEIKGHKVDYSLVLADYISREVSSCAETIINHESFVDRIVERINDKQLKKSIDR